MHSLILLFSLLTPSRVDDARLLPPGVSAKEASEGWIALFDGETTYGWKAQGPNKIDKGVLVFGGNTTASLETTTHFAAFELVVTYRYESNTGGFSIAYSEGQLNSSAKSDSLDGNFTDLKLTAPGCRKSGPLKLVTHPGTILFIKAIKIKPLELATIFNGKDLSGWKEIPGHKSKFSVTENGEINVKDGDGDLQTEAQWDDFILQLDVISNGDHLNSGVFFRCLPGRFWAGYEAQIRNEWQSTVKLKDETTHIGSLAEKDGTIELRVGRETKKLPKGQVESITHHRDKPIDFGTGALYNRLPARRVVSTDRQWFTLTVVAHGNHFAVWVNGYQTADFTDARPPNENARRGRRDGPGCISLQGHDPTTDLSFKNIRLVPLPKP
jgi:hypothetical protein